MKTQHLAAVLLAGLLAAAGARAEIKTQWIDYKQGGTDLQGYLAYDHSQQGKRPAVLLVHRRDGMSDLTLKNAQMVAKLGYVVFAPDIFGKANRPKETKEEQALSAAFNKDRPLMVEASPIRLGNRGRPDRRMRASPLRGRRVHDAHTSR